MSQWARLARIVLHLLDWVGITVKACLSSIFLPFSILCLYALRSHWTLNNASCNDVFLKDLEILLCPHEVEFNHKDNHVWPLPHIIHLCSNHVIEAFTNIALVDDTGESTTSAAGPPSNPDYQSNEEVVLATQLHCTRAPYKQYTLQVNKVTTWLKFPLRGLWQYGRNLGKITPACHNGQILVSSGQPIIRKCMICMPMSLQCVSLSSDSFII